MTGSLTSSNYSMAGALDFLLAGSAAVAAGAVNALAGGGTLITFPTLTALGIMPVDANVTNTVALCPGYLGATLAQARDIRLQGKRLKLLIPAGVIGGVVGAILLLNTTDRTFRAIVPYLILLASGLLAIQEPLRRWLSRRTGRQEPAREFWYAFPVALAAVYGGYFGAGLSVIILATLALMIDDSLTRLNALKQAIAFATNAAAAVFFLFSGRVSWLMALTMAAGALAGGFLGGRLAGHIKPVTLRWVVIVIGITVSTVYFVS